MKASAEASSLAEEAYGIVRRRIVRGTVRLGQVISRRKLAAELGMSFLPVSMALLRLEFEGLLESRPRAGTRVRIPSREDVLGHYVVRIPAYGDDDNERGTLLLPSVAVPVGSYLSWNLRHLSIGGENELPV